MDSKISLSTLPRQTLASVLRRGEIPPYALFADIEEFRRVHAEPEIQEALVAWVHTQPEAALWIAERPHLSRISVSGRPLGVWAAKQSTEAMRYILHQAETWEDPRLLQGILREERGARAVLSSATLRGRLGREELETIQNSHPQMWADQKGLLEELQASAPSLREDEVAPSLDQQSERTEAKIVEDAAEGVERDEELSVEDPTEPSVQNVEENSPEQKIEEAREKKQEPARKAASPASIADAPEQENVEDPSTASVPEEIRSRWAQSSEAPLFDPSAEGSALERIRNLASEIQGNFSHLDLPTPSGDARMGGEQVRSLLSSQDEKGNEWRVMLTAGGGLMLMGSTKGAINSRDASRFERVGLRPTRIEQAIVPLLAEARKRRLSGEEAETPRAEGEHSGITPSREEELRAWWHSGENQNEAEEMQMRGRAVSQARRSYYRGDRAALIAAATSNPVVAEWISSRPEIAEDPEVAESLSLEPAAISNRAESGRPLSEDLSSYARLQRMFDLAETRETPAPTVGATEQTDTVEISNAPEVVAPSSGGMRR